MSADIVALNLYNIELRGSKPRALISYVIYITQGIDRGFNPILREVSRLVIASIIINNPPPNSVTKPIIGS
jgi:hypothetical protein